MSTSDQYNKLNALLGGAGFGSSPNGSRTNSPAGNRGGNSPVPQSDPNPITRAANIPSAAAMSSANQPYNMPVRASSLHNGSVRGSSRAGIRRGVSPGPSGETDEAYVKRKYAEMFALCRQHTSEKASDRASGNGGNTSVKFAYNVEKAVRKLTGQSLDRVRAISDAIFARIAETGHIEETDAATRVDRIAASMRMNGDGESIMAALKQKLLSDLFILGVVTDDNLKFRNKRQTREEYVDRMIDKSVSEVRASSSITSSYKQNQKYFDFVNNMMQSMGDSQNEYVKFFQPLFASIKANLPQKIFGDKLLSDLVYIYLSQFARSVTNNSPDYAMKKETFYVMRVPSGRSHFDVTLREALKFIEGKNKDAIKAHAEASKLMKDNHVVLRLGDIKTFMNKMLDKYEKNEEPTSIASYAVPNLFLIVVRKILKDNNKNAASGMDGAGTSRAASVNAPRGSSPVQSFA
jgi:hypothetical protein